MSRSERALLALLSFGMLVLTTAVYVLILTVQQMDGHQNMMRREVTALMQAYYSTAQDYRLPVNPHRPARRSPTPLGKVTP